MPNTVNYHFAIAMKHLRGAVAFCCWVAGVAILAQTIVWSLLTFTDMRYETIEQTDRATQTEVVSAAERRRDAIRDASAEDTGVTPVDINRQLSSMNHTFHVISGIATAAALVSMLSLLPLMGLTVVLAAGAATPGVERAASAFAWTVLLVMLTLPLGRWFGSVPFDGVFANYEVMAAHAEYEATGAKPAGLENAAASGLLFYARYCVLPLAVLSGLAFVALRFRAGIEAGLIPKTDHRLDPELEKEVANTRATSMVGGGGRTVGALRNALKLDEDEFKKQEPASIRQVSAGERPARPI